MGVTSLSPFPVKGSAARSICGSVKSFTRSVTDLDIPKVAGIYYLAQVPGGPHVLYYW